MPESPMEITMKIPLGRQLALLSKSNTSRLSSSIRTHSALRWAPQEQWLVLGVKVYEKYETLKTRLTAIQWDACTLKGKVRSVSCRADGHWKDWQVESSIVSVRHHHKREISVAQANGNWFGHYNKNSSIDSLKLVLWGLATQTETWSLTLHSTVLNTLALVLILRAVWFQGDMGSGLTFTPRQKRKKGKKIKRKSTFSREAM